MENDTANEPIVPYLPSASFGQVWKLFQETEKQMKETYCTTHSLDQKKYF